MPLDTDPKPRAYFGTAMQKAAILERLRAGPATVRQLETELAVRDATARVHELREDGHDIETHFTDEVNPDGTVSTVGLYVLLAVDTSQPGLFDDDTARGDDSRQR